MRIKFVTLSRDQSGSILFTTLIIAGILGVGLASYLTLVGQQSRSVARSQNWNQSLVLAEAGIEDALQLMNKFAGSPALTNWVNTSAVDNWSRNGTVYW